LFASLFFFAGYPASLSPQTQRNAPLLRAHEDVGERLRGVPPKSGVTGVAGTFGRSESFHLNQEGWLGERDAARRTGRATQFLCISCHAHLPISGLLLALGAGIVSFKFIFLRLLQIPPLPSLCDPPKWVLGFPLTNIGGTPLPEFYFIFFFFSPKFIFRHPDLFVLSFSFLLLCVKGKEDR